MDAINSTILKTTIEAIPVLTEENFSTWKTRITALFKLGGLKDQIINGEPDLEEVDNTILCAIILAKLSTTTHKNVVNSTNEEDAQTKKTPNSSGRVFKNVSHPTSHLIALESTTHSPASSSTPTTLKSLLLK
jgi:hypothetical protein